LTGSRNLLLQQEVAQSLAGRSIRLELLPLSLQELRHAGLASGSPWENLWRGGYPRLYAQKWSPDQWLPSYIQDYLERDVRQFAQIGDLGKFQVFLQLCAGRIGQMLNATSLGAEVGVDVKTVQRWLSILEASFVVFLLRPHHANWGKRLVKTPKLYFWDTGLACSLLRIRLASDLDRHWARGGLWENWAIAELAKNRANVGQKPSYWFWRDSSGHEVDLVSEESGRLTALEIKASATVSSPHLQGLKWFRELAGDLVSDSVLIHAGTDHTTRNGISVRGWEDLSELVV
jgi:hypothetical protein